MYYITVPICKKKTKKVCDVVVFCLLVQDYASKPSMASIQDRFIEYESRHDTDNQHSSNTASRDKPKMMGNFPQRTDSCHTATTSTAGKNDLTTVSKSGKIGPATLFRPRNLTFNFTQSGYQPRDPKRLTLGASNSDLTKPITHSTILDFLDFVDLFKTFNLRTRKDLKELFEQHAVSQASALSKQTIELPDRHTSNKQLGKYTALEEFDKYIVGFGGWGMWRASYE